MGSGECAGALSPPHLSGVGWVGGLGGWGVMEQARSWREGSFKLFYREEGEA